MNHIRDLAAALVFAGWFCCNASSQAADVPKQPRIMGDWWQVAGDPDLGELTQPKQQPVDFGIWQAGDGTWQLWSCIRNTKEPGKTRLFYRWEGTKLTDSNTKLERHSDWPPGMGDGAIGFIV
jgi:hypothetical protein